MSTTLRRVRLSDRAVFGACLAGLVAGIGLFLVLPLAPHFLELHRLPTNRDFDVELRPQGQVTAFWVVSMASFAVAVWQWRRGRRPSWALLLAAWGLEVTSMGRGPEEDPVFFAAAAAAGTLAGRLARP